MCGIAGILGRSGAAEGRDVRRMLDSLVHRGPDQEGLWTGPGVVLGHRRLSILDLSEAGRQPMIDPQTGCAIVFNGEVYNFTELRAELERTGRRFVSGSDTEVVLAAYATWGEKATARLRGMFALAIWDPRTRRTTLARDRLGIKPLYFVARPDGFAFASELRALLAAGLAPRRLDPLALEAYLWHGFVPGPRTIVQGIELLEPATELVVDEQGQLVSRRRYWELPRRKPQTTPEEAVQRASEELAHAVSIHLASDVPLGVFLSGGVDSSVIAALAQRGSSRPVTTFNIRFEETRYDESGYAREVARRLGTDHREVTLSEARFAEQLGDAVGCLDQPTFDAVNSYFVSRAVREAGIKVALAGTGGDELFGGYASFVDLPKARRACALLGRLPRRMTRGLCRALSRVLSGPASEIPPQTRWGKLADLAATCGDRVGMYQVSYALFTDEVLSALAPRERELRYGLYPGRLAELEQLLRERSDLDAISALELRSFLGERLLRDTDTASMAVSLEVRVPILDHVFVEALWQVGDAQRFLPARKKMLLREMAQPELDPALFDRRKAGFELPLGVWCRQRLAPELRSTFRDLNLAHAVGLDAETIGRIWRAFEKGGRGLYWSRVWSLYVLLVWCRRNGVFL